MVLSPQQDVDVEKLDKEKEPDFDDYDAATIDGDLANAGAQPLDIPLQPDALEPSFSLPEYLRSIDKYGPNITEHSPSNHAKFISPYLWSLQKKTVVLSGAFAASTLAAYSAGAYALAAEPLRRQWKLTDTEFNVGITIFVAGFGFAPMILALISEVYGRFWVFVGSGVVFFLGTLGCAITDSYAGMLVSRFITGSGAAVFATLTGGVVSDLFRKEDRNTPMALYSLSIMIGTGLGPLVSGAAVDHLGWRWIFYLQLITIGTTTAYMFFFFEETRSNVILQRKCDTLNKLAAGENALVHFRPAATETLQLNASIIVRSFAFPMKLLCTESVVFWFSLWVSFAWAILYMQFSSISIVFRSVYGFNSAQVGAIYTTIIVASTISTVLAIFQDRITRRILPVGDVADSPEGRLLAPCFQSVLLPIGLFWFGWTSKTSISWISPTLAIGCCIMGIFSIYLAVFNYLADTYHRYASSALAAQSMCRNLLAGIFPLITGKMIHTLGLGGTGSLLGGLGLVLTTIPWLLFFFGRRIRARSPFAKELQDPI